MNGNEIYFLTLSIAFSIALLSFFFSLFSKKTNSSHLYMGNTKGIDQRMVKAVNMFGGDLLSLVPNKVQSKSISSKEINDAFKESGNPWNVTQVEFLALRAAYAFLYTVISIIFMIIIQPDWMIGVLVSLVLMYLGWNKPLNTYKSIAKKRADDFKRHFPEMLDYLTMIMSDGRYTFANAIETVLHHLPDSAVKEEFTKVTDAINTGASTETALNELADRLPSPALEAFVKAVNNANQLNTPMDKLMKARAKKSREDLMNEIEMIIQTLPTKTMLTIGPAAIGTMLTVLMVPVIVALLEAI